MTVQHVQVFILRPLSILILPTEALMTPEMTFIPPAQPAQYAHLLHLCRMIGQ